MADTEGAESCLQCLGSEKVKKACVITFCNLTPVSSFWICSHSLPSDAFGPGSIIFVQFHVETYDELMLLRKGALFKASFEEMCRYVSIYLAWSTSSCLEIRFLFKSLSE